MHSPKRSPRAHALSCAILVLSAAVLAGCEGSNRSDANAKPLTPYTAPALAVEQVATLKATGGTYIENVDDQQFHKVGLSFTGLGAGFGGNQTTVLPGERKLQVYVSETNGYYRQNFNFVFVQGHSYEISKAMNLFARKIKIHDKTANQDYFIE